jgi:hypothetical protein
MHRNQKKPPYNKSNLKTPPIRSRSYQKGHLFIPKTTYLNQPFKNPNDRYPVTTT